MTNRPALQIRRPVLDDPGSRIGYDALVMAHERDGAAAIEAARRSCVIDPDNRRIRKNLLNLLVSDQRFDECAARTPRRRRTLPPRQIHDVDIDAALWRYEWLLEEQSRRADEGWSPSRVEQSKFRMPLDREHLAAFRRSEVSGGTQNAPDRPADFPLLDFSRLYPDFAEGEREAAASFLRLQHAGYLNRLYQNDAPGIDWFDAAIVDDDRFGGRVVDVPGLGPVTAKSQQSAYYACRIFSLIPRNGVVLEIGGGFGATASRLLAIRPDVTCVLTDLPVNMVLSHCYLSSLYGDAVAGLWEDGDRVSPQTRAVVVPPWSLPALPTRVDLVVNTMSFQHMDERNHAFYGSVMRTLKARRLYHVNRNVHIADPAKDTMVVPADRYSFMDDFAIRRSWPFSGKWIEVVADARVERTGA